MSPDDASDETDYNILGYGISNRGKLHPSEHKSVRFSRYGNLLRTLTELVEGSSAGYTAQQLQDQVGVKTKHALRELVERDQLQRLRLDGVYVYFAA